MIDWIRRLFRKNTFDCNSRGIIDFLRVNGYNEAANEVENLFSARR